MINNEGLSVAVPLEDCEVLDRLSQHVYKSVARIIGEINDCRSRRGYSDEELSPRSEEVHDQIRAFLGRLVQASKVEAKEGWDLNEQEFEWAMNNTCGWREDDEPDESMVSIHRSEVYYRLLPEDQQGGRLARVIRDFLSTLRGLAPSTG